MNRVQFSIGYLRTSISRLSLHKLLKYDLTPHLTTRPYSLSCGGRDFPNAVPIRDSVREIMTTTAKGIGTSCQMRR